MFSGFIRGTSIVALAVLPNSNNTNKQMPHDECRVRHFVAPTLAGDLRR